MKKNILFLFIMMSNGWLFANHWTPQGSSFEDNMTFTCVIQIDDVEQTSDQFEVGVFCGDQCRGSQMAIFFPPTQRYLVQLTIFGVNGDQLSFKVYDHESEEELDLVSPEDVTFNSGGYGSLGDPYVLNFTSAEPIVDPDPSEMVFSFNSGWNWWSTYIEMNGVDGLGLLEAALGDNATQIKSQNRFLLYENNVWDGNLTALANEQMYRLYTIEDGDYAINGQCADPDEHTLNLKKGWNWIGYVESVPMEHNTAMANLATAAENDCLKSYNHFATYYEGYGWYGDLEVMEPGLGYMLRVANRGSFTYASVDKSAVASVSQPEVKSYWKPVTGKFPDNMNVLAVIEFNGDELRTENVELAAFDMYGECRGSVMLRYIEPISRYVAFLTVYGEEGDALHFLVRHEDATYQVNERLTMVVDEVVGKGTEPYKMTVKGAGFDEISASLNLYPNPVEQGQEARIELPENLGNATVEVVDVMGRTIRCNIVDGRDDVHIAFSPNSSGVYTIRIISEQGQTWFGKLIVSRRTQ